MQWANWKAELQERSKQVVRKCSDMAKRTMKHTSSYMTTHKKQVITVASVFVLTVTTGASAQYYYKSNIYSIYHVIVNGKEIGVVSSPAVVDQWTASKLEEEKAKNGYTFMLADSISFREESLYKGEYDDESALKELSAIADFKVDAVKIMIDGKAVGYVASQDAADQVLEHLKEKYSGIPAQKIASLTAAAGKKSAVAAASLAAPEESAVKEVAFKENVEVKRESVPSAQILPADKLEDLLAKGTFKDMIHTVVEGDCVGCIAKQYDITSKDIYDNNPGLTENTVLKLGQKINVTAIRPLVTVQVKENVTQKEEIPFNTQYNNNENLPKGDTKVVQSGKNGLKQVEYEIIKENGQVVERNVLKQDVLEQPVLQVVERGTKVIPSRGTGRLSWPAQGNISSGFGTRWGKLHKGIDIAGPGNVLAADNGRIKFAGWDGGYGNAIIIDHGNGMETLYGHLSTISVKVGDVVQKGKKIGVKGSTGNSTGVHLHFEVIQNGRVQNPMRFLN